MRILGSCPPSGKTWVSSAGKAQNLASFGRKMGRSCDLGELKEEEVEVVCPEENGERKSGEGAA